MDVSSAIERPQIDQALFLSQRIFKIYLYGPKNLPPGNCNPPPPHWAGLTCRVFNPTPQRGVKDGARPVLHPRSWSWPVGMLGPLVFPTFYWGRDWQDITSHSRPFDLLIFGEKKPANFYEYELQVGGNLVHDEFSY
jgi:hypothetical protein